MENDLNYISVVFKNRPTPTQTVPADKDEQTIYSEVKLKPQSVVDAAGAKGGGTKPAAPVPTRCIVSVLIITLCVLLGSAAGIIYLSIMTTNQRSENQRLSSESVRLQDERAELQNLTLDLRQQSDQLNGTLQVMLSFFCRDNSCPPCDDGWLRFGKSCYLFYESSDGWKTWKQSKDFCTKTRRVSDLVIVDSLQEQTFIHGRIQYYHDEWHGYWIGLSKQDNGSWMWGDGRVDTLGFWKNTEQEKPGPNVLMIPKHKVNASWHTGDNKFLNKFICESKALIID